MGPRGDDLQNAYRQWAVKHPGHCVTFLPSAAGFAMWFGAAASVWNFNRAADAVQMILFDHYYVDDFNGTED